MPAQKNETGKRFGRLFVLGFIGPNHKGGLYQCLCDCGSTRVINGKYLRNGDTQSCGCLHREVIGAMNASHRMSDSSEFRIWAGMLQRCFNAGTLAFAGYGGRGIKVCDRWCESFENFLADMGPRPSLKHQIDRINNDGNYEPENCRWTTQKEQARNTRRTHWLTFNGLTLAMSEWEERLGFSEGLLKQRINKCGWSIEKALTTPINQRKSVAVRKWHAEKAA